MTEHLTDTTTESITEKCDSLTLRESSLPLTAAIRDSLALGDSSLADNLAASQDSLQQDFEGNIFLV